MIKKRFIIYIKSAHDVLQYGGGVKDGNVTNFTLQYVYFYELKKKNLISVTVSPENPRATAE